MEATQHSGKCQTCPLPHPGDAPCWGPGTGGGERGGLQLYRWSSRERRPWGGWGPQSLWSGSLLPACERTLSHPRPGPGLRHVARAAEREDCRISEPPALGCSGTAAWMDQGVSTCQPPLGGPAQGPRPPVSAVTGQGAGHSGGVMGGSVQLPGLRAGPHSEGPQTCSASRQTPYRLGPSSRLFTRPCHRGGWAQA